MKREVTALCVAMLMVASGLVGYVVGAVFDPAVQTVFVPTLPSSSPEPSVTWTPAPRPSPTAASRSRRLLAPSGRRWDRVAFCESTNRWHIVNPPYYGGLQMNLAFWRTYGGLRFAARPDLATREEQIIVAEHGFAARGAQPWPFCGKRL